MIKNLILFVGSVSLCFVLLEVVFRLIEPSYPEGTTYGKLIQNNKDGFRDREFTIPKPKGTYRVLVLGDSFVWGIGLDVGDTFPKQLEARLQKKIQGRTVEVINTAYPGYNTVDELLVLRDKGIKYEPDMVLLIYFLNDVRYKPELVATTLQTSPNTPSPHKEQVKAGFAFQNKINFRALVEWISHQFKLVAFFKPRLNMLLREIGVFEEQSWLVKLFQSYHDKNPGWEASKNALLEISRISKKHQMKFVVAIYPFLSDLQNYHGKEAHQTIFQYCQKLDALCIDLLQVFEKNSHLDFWIKFDDSHPNAKAHRLAIDTMLPTLIEYIQ